MTIHYLYKHTVNDQIHKTLLNSVFQPKVWIWTTLTEVLDDSLHQMLYAGQETQLLPPLFYLISLDYFQEVATWGLGRIIIPKFRLYRLE